MGMQQQGNFFAELLEKPKTEVLRHSRQQQQMPHACTALQKKQQQEQTCSL